jgi:hypothetical protein
MAFSGMGIAEFPVRKASGKDKISCPDFYK